MTRVERVIPAHEPVPGSTARTALIFKERIAGLAASVEIREYYVSEGEELAVTPPSEALFEVRSGILEMTTQNDKGERRKGEMWTALPGERVAVRTTSEMAILRATYVVKD